MPAHRRTPSDSCWSFNPVEALVEDAVSDTGGQLFTDFLDNLLRHIPIESGAQALPWSREANLGRPECSLWARSCHQVSQHSRHCNCEEQLQRRGALAKEQAAALLDLQGVRP
ncbi:MAG: hypothetical protein SGPRY_004028 [Prymnesium sp.]